MYLQRSRVGKYVDDAACDRVTSSALPCDSESSVGLPVIKIRAKSAGCLHKSGNRVRNFAFRRTVLERTLAAHLGAIQAAGRHQFGPAHRSETI